MRPTALYRFFDDNGTLLYVGISYRPFMRLSQHKGKPWWAVIASVQVEHFPTREEAQRAEARCIQSEQPKYNVAGKITPKKEKGVKVTIEIPLDVHERLCILCAIKGLPMQRYLEKIVKRVVERSPELKRLEGE